MIADGKTFGDKKQRVLQWLKAPQQIDSMGVEEPLDDNIADTIRTLNEKLPFLYTVGSCGGHFRSRDDIRKEYPDATDNQLILPNEGYVSGLGGSIDFVVDENARSEKFIDELEKVIAQYPGAKLYKGRDGYYDMHLIRQLDDGDAFTEEETVAAKKQIQVLLVEIQNLVALSANY